MELAQWQQRVNQQMSDASARLGVLLHDLSAAEKSLAGLLERIGLMEADLAAEKQLAKDERKGLRVRLKALERPEPERPEPRVVEVSS